MTTADALIRGARLAAGFSQTEIATRAGIAQPNVARAESAERLTSVTTCERLVRAAGYHLAVLPGRGTDAFTTAVGVRDALRSQDEERAYRLVIQLADDLAAVHGAERVAATVARPAPSGDVRYDAFLAGVAEARLDEENLPHPRWLAEAPTLGTPWHVAPWTADSRRVADATPPPLRRRGVLIDAAELVSA